MLCFQPSTGSLSPHEGLSLSKLEARRHLVVKRRVMHTLMASATGKCHFSPSSSRGQGHTRSGSMPAPLQTLPAV